MEGWKEKTKWIWNGNLTSAEKEKPMLMLFRKEITIAGEIESAKISISADTRYKLYINQDFVEYGPSRGDREIWFYDEIDITKWLKKGRNIIAVSVLRYPENPSMGNHGMFRTPTPGLFLDGEIKTVDGYNYSIFTDETWRCTRDTRLTFLREEERFAPLMIHEEFREDKSFLDWTSLDYNDSGWSEAFAYIKNDLVSSVSPGNLHKRTIPFLYRKKRRFIHILKCEGDRHEMADWQSWIEGKSSLEIPANTEEVVEIDAGEEMTGFIDLRMLAARGAEIELLYSEAYVQNELFGPEKLSVKKDRCDYINGHLEGYSDRIYMKDLDVSRDCVYQPYWYRCFRFIKLSIKTADTPLLLKDFYYEETGYPLEVKTSVECSDLGLNQIWDISERTLRRCMHETYEDCPYYEQLQYIMDTRQQILYTYAISGDDRLARRCIEDMRRAQRYDGLLNCSYPNTNSNVIPGFSIYYILILYDHMMYFGDKELLRDSMPTVEGILNFFRKRKGQEGYLEKIGGMIGDGAFWSFIDWAAEWNESMGMPRAGMFGALTMENLLYIYGLQKAAEILSYLGREEDARFYQEEVRELQSAVQKHCTGENGMLTDGPGIEAYSQHCQVFAVLTHTGDRDKLRENLIKTIEEEGYAQCTVAMSFYLFRALEEVDAYAYTEKYWRPWRQMIENNCSTCIESESYARSECHGWGALALYEIPSVILGVRPVRPGYEMLSIKPNPGFLQSASGKVYTPKGEVNVSWKKTDNGIELDYQIPEGICLE